MAKDTKSGLESELLGRKAGRARVAKATPQSAADKLKANLEAQRQKAAAMAAENSIYCIQQICPDHTDFINHQEIKAFYNLPLLPAEPELTTAVALIGLAARHKGTKG